MSEHLIATVAAQELKKTESDKVCKNCGATGSGSYCSQCGQSYHIERITLSLILTEAIHFFTHLEKGFGYTFKQLLVSPGKMEKDYLEGHRAKLQKPFSMFFLCATACALAEYWINVYVAKFYSSGDQSETYFFQHYLVLEQFILVPLYAFVNWLFFIRFKLNYAEMLVVILYITSFFFLLIIPINCLKFIFPNLNTRYVELPVIVVYSLITFTNLFRTHPKWKVILLSFFAVVVNYGIATVVQKIVVGYLGQK